MNKLSTDWKRKRTYVTVLVKHDDGFEKFMAMHDQYH